ncbi:hypothetical protein ElyMa_002736400 [Elysia marginata]|uniref:Transmembrane protein n=1 Tax=Elysia marginata TaxID=1093978 RepID=A0AAV4HGR1_9GAST|nr:hypothetical protein ElyMa_002736400 [Elysia marginata]
MHERRPRPSRYLPTGCIQLDTMHSSCIATFSLTTCTWGFYHYPNSAGREQQLWHPIVVVVVVVVVVVEVVVFVFVAVSL